VQIPGRLFELRFLLGVLDGKGFGLGEGGDFHHPPRRIDG